MKAAPRAEAYARKTPTWQLTVSPAVPVVLARHAARLRPLLQEPGLVDDEKAGRRVAQVRDDVFAQVVADGVGVPVRPGQQMLHPVRGRVPEMFRQLPPVLPLGVAQQTPDVPDGPLAGLGSGEVTPDPVADRRHLIRPAGDLLSRRSS